MPFLVDTRGLLLLLLLLLLLVVVVTSTVWDDAWAVLSVLGQMRRRDHPRLIKPHTVPEFRSYVA